MDLAGRTVLITGGTSGIGFALARALLNRGNRVFVAARDPSRLAETSTALPGVETVRVDLADAAARSRFIQEVATRAPGLSVLINNAAVQHPADWTQWRAGQADLAEAEIAVNIAAVVVLSHALLPILRRASSAAIVNLSSGLALAPKKSAPVYSATKAFVHSFSRALRYQCEGSCPHVRVVSVLPAVVVTPMTAGRNRGGLSPESAADQILSGLARGRAEIDVGRTRWLRRIQRLSPGLAFHLLRNA